MGEGPVRRAGKTSIRGKGIPLTEAYLNPFATLAATDVNETEISGSSPTIDAPVENLLERMHRRLETARATSSASPTPSLSGISSIRATGATNADTTPKHPEQFRMDRTADTPPASPPGFEEFATVTMRIPGSEDVTIVGKVLNLSVVSPVMPVSIGSPVVSVAEPHAEISVEIPVGSVKDLVKKFEPIIEPTEMCEAVDMLGIDSSGDDLMYDLTKLAAWIDNDSPFPPSAPRDHVKRSKARKKALKKKYDAEDECRCQDPACATPEFGGFPTTESLPSPSLTTTTTSTSASSSIPATSSEPGGAAATAASGPVPLRVVSQGSTQGHWPADNCMTSIVGGLGRPCSTGRLAGRAQLPTATPAQIATGASHPQGPGSPGPPTSRRCNGGALADLVDDMDEPESTYFLDFFEKVEDEILPIEEFLKTMNHKNVCENIESRCWSDISWWSLGGCPPPTDETGKSKLQDEEMSDHDFQDCVDDTIEVEISDDDECIEVTTIDDNGIFTDVNWLPEVEISDDDECIDIPEFIDMPEHYFDYCFTIDLVATRDNMCYIDGCIMATEEDTVDMFVVNCMQEIISQEEIDRCIFMEEIDEDIDNDHIEEEKSGPHELRPHDGHRLVRFRQREWRRRHRAEFERSAEGQAEAHEHGQDQEGPHR
jgi:hypothetical protein